jgi:hypothetical protein
VSHHPKETCSSCHFFEENNQGGAGYVCTKNPPTAHFLIVPIPHPEGLRPVVQMFSGWPTVKSTDWCGEHKQDILIAH